MSNAAALGSIDVDVGGNIDPLLQKFAAAEKAADAFYKRMAAKLSTVPVNGAGGAGGSGDAQKAADKVGKSLDAAAKAGDRYHQTIINVSNDNRTLIQVLDASTRTFNNQRTSVDASSRSLSNITNNYRDAGTAADRMSRNVQGASNSANELRRTLMASASVLVGAFGLNEIKNLADEYTSFTNRLKAAGLESEKLAETQQKIFLVAQHYGVQLDTIGSLYGRLGQAQKELGASDNDIEKAITAASAAVRLFGSSTEESQGALLQLSQMLGDTNVRAQEFNSVNQGARPILQAAADGIERFHGSIAKLRAEVNNGTVTSKEFFAGWLKGSDGIIANADKLPLTIGASFITLRNALSKYIGDVNSSWHATENIGAGIKALAGDLDVLMPILTTIILAIGSRYVAAAGSMIASSALIQTALFAIQARAAGAATTMEALAFAGGAAGRGILAAFGGGVGIAIMAVAAAVYYYHQRTMEAEAEVKSFAEHQRTANQIIADETVKAKAAGVQVKALGTDHKTAAGYVSAFAGATGDAADALHRQATEAKNARLALIDLAIQNATSDRDAASKRYQEMGQSGSSQARFGNLPENPDRASALERYNTSEATLKRLQATRAQVSGQDLTAFISPNANTGGRDLKAEIADYQKQLVAATTAGNETAQRELLKEIKLRQRIVELMKTGLSLEIASATAEAEKLKAPSTSGRELFTGADADKALGGIGATVTSGKRSYAKQKELHDKYVAYQNGTGPWAALAAAPGTSAHEDDRARDVRKTPGMSLDKIRQAIEAAGGVISELKDEGDHFHVAWQKTARTSEQVMQDRLKNDEAFSADLTKTNDEIAASRQAQLVDEHAIEEAERARFRAAAKAENDRTATKLQKGDLTEGQAAALTKARNDLLALQLAGVDMKERQRLESEALKTAASTHDREIEVLQAQEDIARTASERRRIERQILAAQKEYERKVLQATIDSPFTKPLDRELAKSSMAGLDKRYEGKTGALDRQAKDDLLGTSPAGSKSNFKDQKEQIQRDEQDKLAIVQEALDARIILEQEAAQRRIDIEADAHDKILALENARKEVQIAAAQSTMDSLTGIAEQTAGKQSGIYKAMFAVSKAFAIATSIIHIQEALASATASLPFPANLPVIALVAAEGASIISSIMAVAGSFDSGGWTGDAPRDAVTGVVHGQEHVIKAGPAAKYRPLLDSINAGRDPTAGFRSASNQGGAGNGGLMAGALSRPLNIALHNHAPGVTHTVERGLTRGEVIIIARAEAPKAVAGELERPNSTVRKSLQRNTTVRGRKS